MKICAVFPGTFDPVHLGHINIAERASKIFDKLVIGVYRYPQKNTLFSIEERVEMFTKAMAHLPNVKVVSYQGLTINFAQEIGSSVMVRGLRVFSDFDYEFRMALTNQELNAEIETISLITNHEHTFISSTTVKEIAALGGDISGMVPEYVAEQMKKKVSAGK